MSWSLCPLKLFSCFYQKDTHFSPNLITKILSRLLLTQYIRVKPTSNFGIYNIHFFTPINLLSLTTKVSLTANSFLTNNVFRY